MKEKFIYAYPLDRLPRNSKDEDILKDFKRNDLGRDELPVRKYTVEEFCALINEEMFNEQEYYVRAIEEDKPLSNPIPELRDRYISEIIRIMEAENLTEIDLFDDEDPVYVFWQDRYDMWHRDPVISITLKGKELEFRCCTDNEDNITVYPSSDYGCDFVELLDDMKVKVEEYIQELEPACPHCGCREPVCGPSALLVCSDCGNEYWPGQEA